jgi:hypothetical protein
LRRPLYYSERFVERLAKAPQSSRPGLKEAILRIEDDADGLIAGGEATMLRLGPSNEPVYGLPVGAAIVVFGLWTDWPTVTLITIAWIM